MVNAGDNNKTLVERLADRERRQITIALDFAPGRFLREEASRRGWRLLCVWHCGGRIVPGIKCQGAIITQLPNSRQANDFRAAGCRIVRLGRAPHPDDHETPAVLPDLRAYGIRAAEHFQERQFLHVAFVGHDPWGQMQPMYEGFNERARELGMLTHLFRFKKSEPGKKQSPDERYRRRQRALAEWISGVPTPLGLLANGDFAATQLCFMISQSGLDVPTDVAVMGTGGDQGVCEGSMIPVSSFASSEKRRIEVACDLLARMLNGEPAPSVPILVPPAPIIERQSTRVLAVADPTVAQALRFVWDHFREPLSVSDVAEAVSVSRSKLDRLFRIHFPRGVKAELNRKRLEVGRRLLRTTSMQLGEVADAAGFSSADYMRLAFRKAYGVSPRHFRRKS